MWAECRMGTGLFMRLKRENWLGEFASIEAVNYPAFSGNDEVLLNLVVPLSTLNVFTNTCIELV